MPIVIIMTAKSQRGMAGIYTKGRVRRRRGTIAASGLTRTEIEGMMEGGTVVGKTEIVANGEITVTVERGGEIRVRAMRRMRIVIGGMESDIMRIII